MAFHVVAMPAEEYAAWLRQAAAPAMPPSDPQAAKGQALFMASGCGGCHAIRGTAARGTIGPDLSGYGGRRFLAAGTLPNTEAETARWIAHSQAIKPENLMPPYGIFDEDERRALAAYLHSLK
jgi:cytochrome c oxidase subunit 2